MNWRNDLIMLHYIHDYRRLDDLRRIAGAENESTLSPAFAGLLEDYGREHQLILAREWPFPGRDGATLRADGVLLDRLRLAHGWWEAKDSKDHLDREIEAKLRKGYSSDNILFEDTVQAVLVQNDQETRWVLLANDAALSALLNQFFAFRPPEVEQFAQAAAQFRRDLPTVLDSLVELITQREAENATFRARLAEFHGLCVRAHFGQGLADEGLDILDPCTGTGTFIVELLGFLRRDRAALARKYAGEIHANEIAILPYYIAGLNIEQTYADILGNWREFSGACFVDTLENWGFEKTYSGAQGDLLRSITDENQQRIREQNARRIPIIIGNPPYNANQQNENDNNKNAVASEADARIKATYLKASNAQKTKLYDPYVRFFRWASDRIGDKGIVGFVTNRSYLDARGFDGFRKVAAQEFQEIWIVDLQSDVRRNPKISGTKHNVFGIQTGVVIGFFIRNPRCEGCEIHYLAVDDFLTAIEKRRFLVVNSLAVLKRQGAFQGILPNEAGDWINQPKNDWGNFLIIADREVKSEKSDYVIFRLFSNDINNARDEWVYADNQQLIKDKIKYLIKHYQMCIQDETSDDGVIKWSEFLKKRLKNGKNEKFSEDRILFYFYRPFTKRLLYFSDLLIDRLGSSKEIFPIFKDNLAISITHLASNKPFATLAISSNADWHLLGDTVILPLNRYLENESKIINITDWSLSRFQEHYTDPTITKLDIFRYVYAVLHDPVYRETYALNLKREFPRIPFYPDFRQWVAWGEQLMALHLGYESVEPWPLRRVELSCSPPRLRGGGAKRRGGLSAATDNHPGANAPSLLEKEGNILSPKPCLKADKTAGRIEIDELTVLHDVPPDAWEYRLGHRSALEWILEEYKERTPRDPTIREKFNTYRFADHKEKVTDLLMRVCRVSVETMQIIAAMRGAQR